MNPEYVKNLFTAIAGRYGLANHLLSGGIDFWWRHCVAKQVQDWAPKKILDVATGNGDLAFAISKKSPTAQLIAVDFCPEMLFQARLTQTKKRINAITFLEADGLALPFEEKSFDVVTIAFGLRNMASWEQGLREMHRVLREEGHLLILDFSIPASPLLRTFYRFYLHYILPRLAGWITGKMDAYQYMGQSIEDFPSGDEMLSLLEKCGFKHTAAEPLTGGIASIYIAEKK